MSEKRVLSYIPRGLKLSSGSLSIHTPAIQGQLSVHRASGSYGKRAVLLQQQINLELYFFVCWFNESDLLPSTGEAEVCLGTAATCCPALYCFVGLEGDWLQRTCHLSSNEGRVLQEEEPAGHGKGQLHFSCRHSPVQSHWDRDRGTYRVFLQGSDFSFSSVPKHEYSP